MKFSIIIPAYNCEKYISAAIESAIRQKIDSKEIIVINDGSKDKTKEICLEYSQKYDCIRFVDKENTGVSETRNKGLEISSGDYIIFLDADDELSDNALEIFNNEIEKNNNPDIILSNYYNNIDGEIKKARAMENTTIEKSDSYFLDCILDFYRPKDNIYGNLRTVWAKAFSRDLLNTIRFNKNIKIGEDMLFFLEAVIDSSSIVIVNEYTYIYRINEQSVMRSKKWVKPHNNLIYYESVRKLLEEKHIEKDLFSLWLEVYETEWIDLIKSSNSFSEKYKIFKEYCQDKIFKQYTNTTRSLSKLEKLYILAIKNKLIIFWMILLKVKIYKNRGKIC